MNNRKIAVITGAGGVLCSGFAKELARNGYAVALLDLNEQAARTVADAINAAGGTAKAYKANVLEKESLEQVHAQVLADLGKCDGYGIEGAFGRKLKELPVLKRFGCRLHYLGQSVGKRCKGLKQKADF